MPDPKIDKFKKVLQMDPNDETLWFGLGKTYMGDENWEEAISALESCLKVKPTYSAAIFALAQSLKHANQTDNCRTVCTARHRRRHRQRRPARHQKPGRAPGFASATLNLRTRQPVKSIERDLRCRRR